MKRLIVHHDSQNEVYQYFSKAAAIFHRAIVIIITQAPNIVPKRRPEVTKERVCNKIFEIIPNA